MAREIRAPEQVTGFRDRAALLLYARALAAIVGVHGTEDWSAEDGD